MLPPVSTSRNAKKRRQQQQAQRRRQAAALDASGASRSGPPTASDEFPPESDDPIEPTGSNPRPPLGEIDDDLDGPGYTPVKRGTTNGVLVVALIAFTVLALLLVFR